MARTFTRLLLSTAFVVVLIMMAVLPPVRGIRGRMAVTVDYNLDYITDGGDTEVVWSGKKKHGGIADEYYVTPYHGVDAHKTDATPSHGVDAHKTDATPSHGVDAHKTDATPAGRYL